MKIYYLRPKSIKENLSKTNAQTKEDAIEFFSKIKKLTKKDLLDIYEVSDME